MKTITTTREYDEQGRLVKETVMETETETPDAPVYPPQQACTCGNLYGWCPLHGQRGQWQMPIVTCIGSVGVTPDGSVAYNNGAAKAALS